MALRTTLLLCLASCCGCCSFDKGACGTPCEGACKEERVKTIFTWAVLPDDKDKEKEENGNKQNGEANGEGKNGNGNGEDDDPRSKPLASDRPDFTEASSTVGRGVIQLETGYTYIKDRDNLNSTISHSYPQALLRVGAFADWFEFRFGQNFGDLRATGETNERFTGADDTYLGVKLALTEQKQFLPEMALVLQATVPTGASEFSAERTLPGFNWLFGWDVIEDKLSTAGSFQINKAIEADGHSYVEVASSWTIGYTLTEKLGAYTEWFAFFPSGALSPDIGVQQYFDGGFIYQFTYNIQFDINAGVGLNGRADDYFVGTGLVLRY